MKHKEEYYIPMIIGFLSLKGTVHQTTVQPTQKSRRTLAAMLRGDVVETKFEASNDGSGIFWTRITSPGRPDRAVREELTKGADMKTSRKAYIVVVTDANEPHMYGGTTIVSVQAFTNRYAATMCQLQYEDRHELARVFVRFMNDGRAELFKDPSRTPAGPQ